ncbi:hypothetical protein [Mycobacterium aquaticum]|uniref:Uncharacterized protein n=1 Tax=Mycobacterium aquaticum TaxID=1927124 RepID=A0A1X0A0J3_9MYCO|nr:hypothetical protein [Mycobacterium aquaticum]ORA23415.1 hypothetical protein BST13_35265 [Mycobacterium aquaticum]
MSDTAQRFTVGRDIFMSGTALCPVCSQPFKGGERVYDLTHDSTPWRAEDDEDREYASYTWHVDCDQGSLAAASYSN